tara:strand:+ start:4587 stop:4709 length:123 start_codon:yes stop_codon:yes gene_type:complete
MTAIWWLQLPPQITSNQLQNLVVIVKKNIIYRQKYRKNLR